MSDLHLFLSGSRCCRVALQERDSDDDDMALQEHDSDDDDMVKDDTHSTSCVQLVGVSPTCCGSSDVVT